MRHQKGATTKPRVLAPFQNLEILLRGPGKRGHSAPSGDVNGLESRFRNILKIRLGVRAESGTGPLSRELGLHG